MSIVLSIWHNPEGAYGDFSYCCEEVDAYGRVERAVFAGSAPKVRALALAEKYAARGADVSMVMEDDSELVW